MRLAGSNWCKQRQAELRDLLIQAASGNPISADDAWALIHRWDAMEYQCERLEDPNWCKRL